MRRLAIKVRDIEDVRVALEEILHIYDFKLNKSVQGALDEGINYVVQGFNFNYMTKETSDIKECFIVDLSDKDWQLKLYKHRAIEEKIRENGLIKLTQNFVEKHGLEAFRKLKKHKSFEEFLDERQKQEG